MELTAEQQLLLRTLQTRSLQLQLQIANLQTQIREISKLLADNEQAFESQVASYAGQFQIKSNEWQFDKDTLKFVTREKINAN